MQKKNPSFFKNQKDGGVTPLGWKIICKPGFVQVESQTRGFPGGSDGKESACNVGNLGSTPGLGMATHPIILVWRIPMDRGAWRATVHGVAKSQTRLSS